MSNDEPPVNPANESRPGPSAGSSSLGRSVPWRTGALVLTSLAILLGILVATGPLRVFGGAPLTVDFAYSGPVKPGAAVRLSGQVVGTVQDVELLAGQDEAAGEDVMVRLQLKIQDRAWPAVTDRARFYVTTLGVLGEHYVDIVPQPGGKQLASNSRVRGQDLARSDLLLPRAAALLEIMSGLLDEGREDALGLVKKTTGLIDQLDGLLQSGSDAPVLVEARALMGDLSDLVGGLKAVVDDGKQLKTLLRRADRLAEGLESADLPATVADGRRTLGAVEGTLARLDRSPILVPERQEEVIRKLELLLVSLDAVSRRADKLLAQIERAEGGAGKAFHDEELVDDLKSLLRELRRNPLQILLPEPRDP